MKALLTTRCGCVRIMDVMDPPAPSIVILIEPPGGWRIPGEKDALVKTRTFHRVGKTAHHVIYEEEITP